MCIFNHPSLVDKPIFLGLWFVGMLFLPVGHALPVAASSGEPLPLYLDDRPFSPALCQATGKTKPIRIHVKHHRDLRIEQVEGQFIPPNGRQARSKDYTHFVSLNDLTDGLLAQGHIAFDRAHAIIFTSTFPKGIGRQAFLLTLTESQRPIAERALTTFLRLHPILMAAIDTCRPYPPFVVYGTDEEIDRIEAARHTFTQRVRSFNANQTFVPIANIPDPALDGGFVDPHSAGRANVSYQAMNPLNFYVP